MPHNSIEYTTVLNGIEVVMLQGFFEGWPNPPSPHVHLRILHGSSHVILAVDQSEQRVVGFITAVSDGFFAAFVSLLEVRPSYRGQGIGTELVRRILDELQGFYSIDVACDEQMQAFYEKRGLRRAVGAMSRDYNQQATGVA